MDLGRLTQQEHKGGGHTHHPGGGHTHHPGGVYEPKFCDGPVMLLLLPNIGQQAVANVCTRMLMPKMFPKFEIPCFMYQMLGHEHGVCTFDI